MTTQHEFSHVTPCARCAVMTLHVLIAQLTRARAGLMQQIMSEGAVMCKLAWVAGHLHDHFAQSTFLESGSRLAAASSEAASNPCYRTASWLPAAKAKIF